MNEWMEGGKKREEKRRREAAFKGETWENLEQKFYFCSCCLHEGFLRKALCLCLRGYQGFPLASCCDWLHHFILTISWSSGQDWLWPGPAGQMRASSAHQTECPRREGACQGVLGNIQVALCYSSSSHIVSFRRSGTGMETGGRRGISFQHQR